MYAILQSKVRDYILSQLLVDSPEIRCGNRKGYITYICDGSVSGNTTVATLESLVRANKVRVSIGELISGALSIYGLNVWHVHTIFETDLLHYKSLEGVQTRIKCVITTEFLISLCLINGLALKKDGYRQLLIMLYDPIKFMQLMDAEINMSGTAPLFETLAYCIQKYINNSTTQYLLIQQLVNDGVLIRDIANTVLSMYIYLLG